MRASAIIAVITISLTARAQSSDSDPPAPGIAGDASVETSPTGTPPAPSEAESPPDASSGPPEPRYRTTASYGLGHANGVLGFQIGIKGRHWNPFVCSQFPAGGGGFLGFGTRYFPYQRGFFLSSQASILFVHAGVVALTASVTMGWRIRVEEIAFGSVYLDLAVGPAIHVTSFETAPRVGVGALLNASPWLPDVSVAVGVFR